MKKPNFHNKKKPITKIFDLDDIKEEDKNMYCIKKKNKIIIKNIRVIKEEKELNFDNKFFVTFFNVNHSITNAFGVIIKTLNGTIVTTGDYRIDRKPEAKEILGSTNLAKIRKLSNKEGITLLL